MPPAFLPLRPAALLCVIGCYLMFFCSLVEIAALLLVLFNFGTIVPDFGTVVPDIGTTVPAIGTTVPDLGTTVPDLGTIVPNLRTTVPSQWI
jgi:hypothetical protein